MKSRLEENAIEMYSTHNKAKSVIAETFIRTLKNEIYKYMTWISKNEYIYNLDDIVNKCNNTYHSAIKMKPVDVKASLHINSSKETNNKEVKFKIGDIVRISKYKNSFTKGFVTNSSEEVFVIKKLKTLSPGHMLLVILKAKKLLERFTKKNCLKHIKKTYNIYSDLLSKDHLQSNL